MRGLKFNPLSSGIDGLVCYHRSPGVCSQLIYRSELLQAHRVEHERYCFHCGQLKTVMSDPQKHSFSFESSIPVLRMLDEKKTKAFYLDYLGFEVEWEHRFTLESPSSSLYMQIRQGASVLHLNGHADDQAPTTEVRIPVHGLEEYCQWLGGKSNGGEKPEVVDPRYEGRKTDMNLIDPSGNLIVFWLAKGEQE